MACLTWGGRSAFRCACWWTAGTAKCRSRHGTSGARCKPATRKLSKCGCGRSTRKSGWCWSTAWSRFEKLVRIAWLRIREGTLSIKFRDLLALEPLNADELSFLLDQSKPFQEIQKHPLKKLATLRGKTVALAFFETSTRTRISFGAAASRLGADTIHLLGKFGCKFTLCGPAMWVPRELEKIAPGTPIRCVYRIEEALEGADVIMMLRVQTERLDDPPLSADDYVLLYQLNAERLRRASRNAIVLHTGPINRGIEITP